MSGLKNNIPPNIIRCYIMIFSFGAVVFPLIEILYRNHTHFTMSILGGICGIIIYRVNTALKYESLFTKAILSSILITIAEFISGIFLNIILKLNVWDYSLLPFNLLGQICPRFSFIWFLLALPSHKLCDVIDINFLPYLNGNLFFISSTKEINYSGKAQKTQKE